VFLRTALALLLATAPAVAARAQTTTAAPAQTQVVCASKPGERQTCAAEPAVGSARRTGSIGCRFANSTRPAGSANGPVFYTSVLVNF
jgi:hypothetical protein